MCWTDHPLLLNTSFFSFLSQIENAWSAVENQILECEGALEQSPPADVEDLLENTKQLRRDALRLPTIRVRVKEGGGNEGERGGNRERGRKRGRESCDSPSCTHALPVTAVEERVHFPVL